MDQQKEVRSAEELDLGMTGEASKTWVEPRVECLDLATADLGGSL